MPCPDHNKKVELLEESLCYINSIVNDFSFDGTSRLIRFKLEQSSRLAENRVPLVQWFC